MHHTPGPYCLGIESSCDETAMAVVRDGQLLAQEVLSQASMHSLFGGVVPEMASREHYRALMPLARKVLDKASLSLGQVGVVAVARGPGLLGALLTGLGFAKGLVLGTGASLVGVNHLHAHLLAPGLEQDLVFPSLGVLVSGGHTQLFRMDAPGDFTLLGRTLDDAAGEAFDKVAKKLNLPYPGGRLVDELGRRGKVDKGMFTRPYLDNDNLDFSFSGLKTAVALKVDQDPVLSTLPFAQLGKDCDLGAVPDILCDLCASFNWAVADTLRVKAKRALEREQDVRGLIIAGGVAANSVVRESFSELGREWSLRVLLPSPELCTDNAAMIAYAGERMARAGRMHGLDLEAVPRGRPVPEDWKLSGIVAKGS